MYVNVFGWRALHPQGHDSLKMDDGVTIALVVLCGIVTDTLLDIQLIN